MNSTDYSRGKFLTNFYEIFLRGRISHCWQAIQIWC